jgi:hypothetical protein
MSHFNQLPEFAKEFQKLRKKFRTLPDDLRSLEKVIAAEPFGIGKNFTIIHSSSNYKIIKTRLACRSLQGDRALRVIYAYHETEIRFMYIEIYFKGTKENEDQQRVAAYISDNSI